MSVSAKTRALLTLCVVTAGTSSLAMLMGASAASAAVECGACSPWWHVTSTLSPASVAPGGEGMIFMRAENLGDGPTSGSVSLSAVLPADVSVVEEGGVPQISYRAYSKESGSKELAEAMFLGQSLGLCSVTGQRVGCQTDPPSSFFEKSPFDEPPFDEPPVKENIQEAIDAMTAHGPVKPYEYLEVRVKIKNTSAPVDPQDEEYEVGVSGGGAAAVSRRRPLPISSTPAAFGTEDFSIVPEEEEGAVDRIAGSHPYQLTTTINLNQGPAGIVSPFGQPASSGTFGVEALALVRNLQFKLPAGLIGNATVVPQCSDLDFRNIKAGGNADLCPEDTVVGVATVTFDEPAHLELKTYPLPLFNLVPERGEPARFGFEFAGTPVTLDASVRTGTDYGVTVDVSNITQLANFISSTVTFWGVPGESSHNESRGWACLASGTIAQGSGQQCLPSTQSNPPPFLTLPTSCSAPFKPSVQGESWPIKADATAEPATMSFAPRPYSLQDSFGRALGVTGCNGLPFAPQIETALDVQSANAPSGLKVDVHVPQEVNENGAGRASANVKDITVAFPEGMAVNPAAADGLQACTEAQAGYQDTEELGSLPGIQSTIFSPTLPEPLEQGVNFCPDASKIGTVTIRSPLLPASQLVEGSLYLATPAPNGEAGKNPFNSLIAAYIIASEPVSGTVVKLPGQVVLDPVTGRVTAIFRNNPQLAFEDAEIHLFGGSRAPFSTPSHCGSYTTTASFTPWSGTAPVDSSSTFAVTSGPNGSPCPGGVLPFSPSLAAGTTNINAAAFSPLVTTIGREDGQQNIQTVQLHMPAGLSGILSGVKLCPEAQADAGTCGPESRIGHTVVSVGLGGEPFSVEGGEVFLTETYGGAPFGLSIVNEAKAGPFDLGKVVVRAKIEVDPHTAQLTITTDPSGAGAIPHILDGIPLQIKHVSVTIDRPGFTFNPTNCNPQQVTGTIGSVEGASSNTTVPFQVTNCASLKFAPQFSVSTSGRTSKANGASLTAKLSEPNAPQGTQANITRVKVDLPKQLPSRLTTLQKACTNKQFELNPANCPKESKIGIATVTTPLLPVPLTGPAIFVSHGGEAFPSLTMVLQGYGVTVDLVGTTFISKAGITSTTFKTVPDVPFNTFQLTLPQGKFSALAANGNLCTSKLTMPTEFLGQNGMKINQDTPVSVTGCAKAKALTRAQKLTKALKTCHKQSRNKRAACEKTARRKYGPVKKRK
jgi:hypothetical protein